MIIEDFDELKIDTSCLQTDLVNIAIKLDEILKRDDKSFSVCFKGKTYEFYPPITKKENRQLKRLRKEFITRMLLNCLKNLTNKMNKSKNFDLDLDESLSVWSSVLAFSMGEDTRNHKFERISVQVGESYTVEKPKIGSLGVPSVPLDDDSYHVQVQKDKELDAEKI